MSAALSLQILPGPSFIVEYPGSSVRGPDGDVAMERILDQLGQHLQRLGLITTRQTDERLCVFVGDFARRDELVERTQMWLVAKGCEVSVERWET